MPYPNEHSCRVKEPGGFEKNSFRRMKQGKLSIIIGKLKGKTSTTTQAFRYPTDKWSEGAARAHCKEQKGTFEPAGKSEQENYSNVELVRIKSVEELPGPAQAIWNDVYQIVTKKLKKEGIDTAIAKSRARRAATMHINRYWAYDEDKGKWTKKPKE